MMKALFWFILWAFEIMMFTACFYVVYMPHDPIAHTAWWIMLVGIFTLMVEIGIEAFLELKFEIKLWKLNKK